jgi:hypothetical protein
MGLKVLAVERCGQVAGEQRKEAVGAWTVVVVADRQELVGAWEEHVDARKERCYHRGRRRKLGLKGLAASPQHGDALARAGLSSMSLAQ